MIIKHTIAVLVFLPTHVHWLRLMFGPGGPRAAACAIRIYIRHRHYIFTLTGSDEQRTYQHYHQT
jgi:hypothetical protein